jgi:hypothetical protein
MSSKINQLLQQWPPGTVGTLRWLRSKSVDHRLADKYVQSGWLERLGHGAYKRTGATVDWTGAVHALQAQLALNLHPGGMTAIELRGYSHYVAFGQREVVLFGTPGTKLPLPKRQSYEEAVQVMESLTSLRPQVLQRLLENCTSVKTKRLFMHAAERTNHAWLKRLDLSKVDFGSGRRTIHAGGHLDKKYDLVITDPMQG